VLLSKLTQLQTETTPALSQLTEVIVTSNASRVEEHVRSVDISLKEISQKLSNSAETQTSELRDELRTIAKILAAEAQKSDTRVN
jgi:hypothetical protein